MHSSNRASWEINCAKWSQMIRELRRALGETQDEFGKRFCCGGRSRQVVRRWEQGKTVPSLDWDRRIIRQLWSDYLAAGELVADRAGKPECEIEGARVKEIRLACGDTQARFAVKMGVTVKTVNNWESGRSVPREHQQRLAEIEIYQKRLKSPRSEREQEIANWEEFRESAQ